MAISNKVANPTTGNGGAYGLLVGLLALVREKVRIRDLLGRENFAY
jgi:hypothetical protein